MSNKEPNSCSDFVALQEKKKENSIIKYMTVEKDLDVDMGINFFCASHKSLTGRRHNSDQIWQLQTGSLKPLVRQLFLVANKRNCGFTLMQNTTL